MSNKKVEELIPRSSRGMTAVRRIRSFVRRNGRRTEGQERARESLWPQCGLEVQQGLLDLPSLFGREAPCYLEIGFGSGQSLLALAEQQPDKNFIGIETHTPGIGALLLGVELKQLANIRVYNEDAIDVLEKCIPDESLEGIQLFFPDPWQKRKHHERRIIQSDFIKQVLRKLKSGGELHVATDWEDYAKHMMRVLSQETALINLAGPGQFAERSPYRPIVTKFERRALREGRNIWEFRFQKP